MGSAPSVGRDAAPSGATRPRSASAAASSAASSASSALSAAAVFGDGDGDGDGDGNEEAEESDLAWERSGASSTEELHELLRGPGLPLIAYDQGRVEMCTSCSYSFCCVLQALRRLSHEERRVAVRNVGARPCPLYAYLLQVQKECMAPDARCKCADACSAECDLACGSIAKFLIPVFKMGVPSLESTSKAGMIWAMNRGTPPPSRLPPVIELLSHSTYHSARNGDVLQQILSSLRAGDPCVANLRVHPNQVAPLRATHVGSSPGGRSDRKASDAVFSLPAPSADGPAREIGHAVSIYGSTRDKLLVRNSYGPEWGCRGDFNIPHSVAHDARTFHFVIFIRDARFVSPGSG